MDNTISVMESREIWRYNKAIKRNQAIARFLIQQQQGITDYMRLQAYRPFSPIKKSDMPLDQLLKLRNNGSAGW